MNRADAIHLIARDELAKLTVSERADLIFDRWGIDETDDDWPLLPEQARVEIKRGDEMPSDPSSPEYDALILSLLAMDYLGVLNGYLERRLLALGISAHVTGEHDARYPCPCCRYETLTLLAEWDICRVCGWEDDGMRDPDRVSGPNHLTLGEGRANFATIGASKPWAAKYVLKDGPERYPRADRYPVLEEQLRLRSNRE